jgi:alkylation response protein AidB-like acyl-CoA dehydrogenase
MSLVHTPFGEQIPFCEPYWYQGGRSPHYTENHARFRAVVRKFVDEELKPNVDKWIGKGYPREIHERAYELGINGLIYPRQYGGTKPDDYDPFYELILIDEIGRVTGFVMYQLQINSMGLPPILNYGSEALKKYVCPDVISGKKFICLAISEPYAGSDVAGIKTTAVRQGDYYIVNGTKKWITGGTMGDFFTTAVRTGGDGAGGISLLLIDRNMEGVSVRKMETQFDTTHSTTFVTLEDVKVPVTNLIGKENEGFKMIVSNFNHERFIFAVEACRKARMCYEESIKFALQRRTFGKRLIEHQAIRGKLAEMVRMIEALYDSVERVAYQIKTGADVKKLGMECALIKVNGSRTFQFCAREAVQIFGGSGMVKEGKGKLVERMYRETCYYSIPGGAEDILLDFVIRSAGGQALKAKL